MAIDKKIGQLPVETNILNVIAIPGINIAGTNIQISGADIAAALGGITSISSTDTNLLSVNTVGSDSELTIQTAPITKGGTALATADQIVTYVATQTGGGLTLQNVLDNGSTATGIATDVSINKTGSTHDTTLSLTDNDGGISQTDGTWTATNGIETSALSFLQLTNGTITSQIVASKTEARMKWSDTGGTNTLDINGTSNVFTDAINSKGLEYAGAYKSFFTLHSLVDKDYVDTQISSIGTPTLQQVMTAGSSAIGLSSTVQVSTSGSIILNSPGFTYEFGTSNPTTGEKANIQIASGAGLDMYTFSGTSNNDFYSSLGFASGDGQINLFTEGFNPGANRAELTLSKTTGVELKYINNRIVIDASNMTVTDASLTPKGLVYGGAYKANFTLYSLVDKDYVDTQIAAIPGGTPGLSGVTAKTVPVMNAGATAYIDSAVESDGTNVGIGIGESSARKLFVYGTAANSEIIYAGTTDGGDGVSVSMSPGSTGRDCKAFDAKLVSTGSGDGNLRGYYLSTNVNGAKTIDELYGIHIGNMTTNVATTINNLYQVYIGTHGSATKGTGEFYGIYQAGTDDKNYFGGNVGIGTDAPDSVLNIEGTKGKLKLRLDDENGVSNAVNQLFLTSEEATYTNYISIGSTTTSAELQFGMIGPSAPSAKVGSTNDSFILATSAADNMNFINNEGTGTSDNIAFYAGKAVADDLSSVTADLIILGNGTNRGYVGIGTETPTEKLDVVGNTKISGTLNIGTLGIGTSVTNLGLDGSGNVVTSSGGSAGPDSITFDIFNTSPTSPDPYTIYDDGNIRLLFDEATTDDIEIVILTNPSTGPVHVVWSEPTAGTSGSANVTTASGQVPLNTEVSADDVVDFVIWAPEDSSYPYYEAKVTVSNSSFTSIPAVGRVSKWNTPS